MTNDGHDAPFGLGRVLSARIERMAATDTPQAAERALDGAVLSNGADEVVAAGRGEAAHTAQPGAEQKLIGTDHGNQREGRSGDEQHSDRSHARPFPSRWAIRTDNLASDPRIARNSG